ncbi:hypothetical protein M2427_008061 [Bradyrhizobium sp. BR13661]|jgi:hypothetical protein|nr:hypothetical protein [Bradyrhizobium sp. BR13661]
MPNGSEDLQIFSLNKAFQKITDQDTRRSIVLNVEAAFEHEQSQQKSRRTKH